MRHVVLAAGLCTALSGAQAATLTDTQAVNFRGFTVVAEDDAPGGGVGIESGRAGTRFDNFDERLGTLESVKVQYAFTTSLEAELFGDSNVFLKDEGRGSASGSLEISFAGQTLTRTDLLLSPTCDGNSVFVPDCPIIETVDDILSDTLRFTPSQWARFAPGQSLLLDFEFQAFAGLLNGDRLKTSFGFVGSSSFRIEYTYSEPVIVTTPAVPLPAGLPLLLAGLGALGVMRRGARS